MEALFAIQDEDVVKGQLEHRRANLPERTAVIAVEAERAATMTQVQALELERLDYARRQHRYEGEVTAVEVRIIELNEKLYSGGITSPKEAASLQDEINHLLKRQDDLEGQVLEIMETLEPVDARLKELAEVAEQQDMAILEARESLKVAEAGIVDKLAESAKRRTEAVASVGSDLLARYERNRPTFGSSAVVGFSGSDCSGCPSSMPAVEADRVRCLPAGTLADCNECGRLVAR
ncbi:MAG: hypothetical protein CL467_05105 [Acidimicrobiaceae bacterium]|nr:hypothetical protein [Acidimicrobiaceae bacterium]